MNRHLEHVEHAAYVALRQTLGRMRATVEIVTESSGESSEREYIAELRGVLAYETERFIGKVETNLERLPERAPC